MMTNTVALLVMNAFIIVFGIDCTVEGDALTHNAFYKKGLSSKCVRSFRAQSVGPFI